MRFIGVEVLSRIRVLREFRRTYKFTIKKLLKDKTELKSKLKRILDEYQNLSKNYKSDIEKYQEYYKEQNKELSDEKDSLYLEIQKLKTELLESKDNARNYFDEKLLKYKDSLEKKYDSKNNQVIKRLEQNIKILLKLNLSKVYSIVYALNLSQIAFKIISSPL